MSDIKRYEPLWDAWSIEEKIGQGAVSRVYRARRDEFGKAYYAAVKIISVPPNMIEYKQMRSNAFDETAIHDYYQAQVTEILREIRMMGDLRGNSNIVSFEDHQVIEKEDDFGWDIIIRMELLTSLLDFVSKRPLHAAEVVKLGIHMCKALELCAVQNIIYRDINPENIFVSQYGEYKLGDFGIARGMEKSMTMSTTSHKDAFTSMAPEIVRGEEYDASVSIYSLGILMYHCLNRNRPPFLPDHPQPILPSHAEEAMRRRMAGEPFPELRGVSAEFSEILHKACAYKRGDRYSHPGELRAALEALGEAVTDAHAHQEGIPGWMAPRLVLPGQAISRQDGENKEVSGVPVPVPAPVPGAGVLIMPEPLEQFEQALPLAIPLDDPSFGNTPPLPELPLLQAGSMPPEGSQQAAGGYDASFLSGTVILAESEPAAVSAQRGQLDWPTQAMPASQVMPSGQPMPASQGIPSGRAVSASQGAPTGQNVPAGQSGSGSPAKPPKPVKPLKPVKPPKPAKEPKAFDRAQLPGGAGPAEKKSKSFLGGTKKVPLLVAGFALVILLMSLTAFFILKPGGYGISVNGQADIVVAKKKDAQAVLDELTAHYTRIASATSNDVSSTAYEEEVVVAGIKKPSEIKSKEDALQALISGRTPQTVDHMVIQGETIQDIARHYSVTAAEVLAANEGETEWTAESQVEEGTRIKIVIPQPYLHVIIEGKCDITEEIAYETERKPDDNVVKYTTEVQRAGEKGAKSVSCTYVTKNGVFIQKNILAETMIKEPVKEILLEGTKAFRVTRTGEGITDEKLAELIETGEIPGYVTELFLGNNAITDLTPLLSLKGLEVLNLDGNKVKSLAGVDSWTRLTTLSMANNAISELQPLEALPALVSLNLSGNSISGLTSLKTLTELVTLKLDRNSIKDIAPLQALKKLRTLSLNNNQISSIAAVSTLKGLTELALANNLLKDLAPLDGLTNLKTLDIKNNADIETLMPLFSLKKLKTLEMTETEKLENHHIGLKQRLPECDVIRYSEAGEIIRD